MEAQTRGVLTFTEIDGPWSVVLLIAVLAAGWSGVAWQYSRERGTLSLRARRGLGVLRGAVWLIVVVTLAGPALIPVETRHLPPEVVLLRDASQSMAVRDAYEGDAARRIAAALRRSDSSVPSSPPSRVELVERLLRTSADETDARQDARRSGSNERPTLWDALQARARIQLIDFSADSADTVVALARDVDVAWPTWRTNGRATDLGAAIRAALEVEGASAAILVTDGQHSTRSDPRDAAREAARRGVPLFVVGVGSPRRPRDLRVANVYCRPHVWKSEPFDVEATLTFHVPDATSAKVELVETRMVETRQDETREDATSQDDPATGQPPAPGANDARVVQSMQVELAADANQLVCRLSHRIDAPGRYSLAVRVAPLDGDTQVANGEPPSAVVRVLDKEQLRVLVVAGEASWDFQQVERLLNREPTVASTCWLQAADPEIRVTGSRPIERLPSTQAELDWYDVLVLFDPDPTSLPESWSELLLRFAADHAGGVLYVPSSRHAPDLLDAPVGQSLRRLLPVDLPDGPGLRLGGDSRRADQAWTARVVPAQADHPVLRLAGEAAENDSIWERMPPLFTSFPAVDARPTSRTLLEHGDPTVRAAGGPRPLLVVGQYRSARAAFLGMQGIWRWRGVDASEAWGDRLWLQLVRYLAEGRAWEGRRQGRLETDRPRYELGDRVTISLRIEPDASLAPDASAGPAFGGGSASDGVRLARIAGVESAVPLHAVTEQPGLFEGVWIARQAGPFVASVEDESREPIARPPAPPMPPTPSGTPAADPGVGPSAGAVNRLETSFRVDPPQAEANARWLDEVRLRELAELAGGRYFDAADLASAIEAIPARREVVSTRRPAQPLWDRAAVLLAVATLLSLEWTVRRRHKLV